MPRKDWSSDGNELVNRGKALRERSHTIIRKAKNLCSGNENVSIAGVVEKEKGYVYFPEEESFKRMIESAKESYETVLLNTNNLQKKRISSILKKKIAGFENKITEYSCLLGKKIFFVLYDKESEKFIFFGDKEFRSEYKSEKAIKKKKRLMIRYTESYYEEERKKFGRSRFRISKEKCFDIMKDLFEKLDRRKQIKIIDFCLKNYPSFFEKIKEKF